MSTIKERSIIQNYLMTDEIVSILLLDRSSGNNIIWATDDYLDKGLDYQFDSEITINNLTNKRMPIVSRVKKIDEQKNKRKQEKAEVFTPSWICNHQNNLIDDIWFGKHRKRFNTELNFSWETNYYHVKFPNIQGKTWVDYVNATRLEVSCGEAPYITSRYDAVSGQYIAVKNRIGLLDRKLRVISENTILSQDWIKWAKKAVQSIYGYEWQGDSLFLARQNILLSVIEYYYEKFHKPINSNSLLIFAEIISWNIWQMDGLKFVIPNSCKDTINKEINLLGEVCLIKEKCKGCSKNDNFNHNGIYSCIMDWNKKEIVRFIDIIGEKNNGI